MIDKKKEAECLAEHHCSFPDCNHICGYNPDVDDTVCVEKPVKEVRKNEVQLRDVKTGRFLN